MNDHRRFLATHVGSLPRTQELKQLMFAREDGLPFDRFSGFGGSGNSYVFQDLEAYPGTKARMFDDPGRTHRKAPACNAPISIRDLDAPKQDAQRLQHSLGGGARRRACFSMPPPQV
jgi:5-methyltetrahydropteroyltriglutamate--homocysteine methyltransferase